MLFNSDQNPDSCARNLLKEPLINYQKYFGTNANNSKIFNECGKTLFE